MDEIQATISIAILSLILAIKLHMTLKNTQGGVKG